MTTEHILRVDWLNVTIPLPALPLVREALGRWLGDAEDREVGIHFYKRSARYECGGLLAWTDDNPRALVSLSGDALSQVPADDVLGLLGILGRHGGKCTRIDLAYDDLSRRLPLKLVGAAAEAGNFTGFKVWSVTKEQTRRGQGRGLGITFGKKGNAGSGRQVIFYDKGLESNGLIDAVRVEARFFGDAASLVFDNLYDKSDRAAMERSIGRMIGGSIDFLDRSTGETHLDRCERLAFWSDVLSVLGAAKIAVDRVKPPLQETLEYFGRVALPVAFALFYEIAAGQGQDPEVMLNTYCRMVVGRGKQKLDRGWRPGAKELGLDLPALLADVLQDDGPPLAPGVEMVR